METLHWVEVRLLVPETDPLELEALEREILDVSPGGFASESWDAPPLPGEREPVPLGMTRYLVYVGEHALEAARLSLARAIARWPAATLTAVPLDDGWRERWKRFFVPLQASPRIVVAPPWETPEVAAGQHLLVIEPAMAFGTAQHETTALCLVGIDRAYHGRIARTQEASAAPFARLAPHSGPSAAWGASCRREGDAAPGPRRVLDVGSGTGILGLAAAMLGAEHVVGIDVDTAAVLAARDNLRLNPVLAGADIAWSDTPIGEVDGAFDLVVANILTPTLLMLAGSIAARVAPGGLLFLSGILADQAPEIVAAFAAEGLAHRGTEERNGWVRVDFSRVAG